MIKKYFDSFVTLCFKGRFLFLLISLLGLIVLTPLLEGFIRIRFLMDIFISSVFISGIYAVSPQKHFSLIAAIFSLPMLVSIWSTYYVEIPFLLFIGDLFGILFFGFMVITILFFISREHKVTVNVINGAIVVYLLIALMWVFIFRFLENIQPGSFAIAQENLKESRFLFVYYSFVTITTLGYGDITPLTDTARAFSLLEAVIGQMYLVVLVARLVGIHIAQSMEKKSP